MIHQSADVQTLQVGTGTRIWQFVVVLPGAKIGRDCNICSHVLIENDVIVGDRVTVKSGVQLWDGVTIESDVFVGPNATFTNDSFPRSKVRPASFERTIIRRGASIGAGAVILPGIEVGAHAMVGAGAVVTRSVPPYAVVVGNPARIQGYTETANEKASKLQVAAPGKITKAPSVGGVKIVDVKNVEDLRGSLAALEFSDDLPFRPNRLFLVYGVPSKETRGEHAHKTCHQFLVCVSGSCSVVVDDGSRREQVELNSPRKGLYMPPMTWGIQYKYSPDAVLMVLASHPYDSSDYIRSYDDFVSMKGGA